MIRFFVFILLVLMIMPQALAQSENTRIRQGNRDYNQENFQDAERSFREALEANPQNRKALYNLANALYRQGRYEEASNILDGLSQMDIPDNKRADVYHNLGNANMGLQNIQEGIEAYKNSLRIRPDDNDTRHNLAYALRQLQEQEQQQQDQQDQDDQEGDDEQDQQQDQQPGDDDQQDQEQQQQPRPDQISPQDAERILDALNQREQEVQERIDREERQARPVVPERQW